MSSDEEEVCEIRGFADNGKEYLIQNGVPYKVAKSFSGFNPKVKFITSSLKQWFNPEDYDEDSMPDKLKEIAAQIYAKSGKSAADTQNAPGENLFEKPTGVCKRCDGTGFSSIQKKKCVFCKGTGNR